MDVAVYQVSEIVTSRKSRVALAGLLTVPVVARSGDRPQPRKIGKVGEMV